MSFAPIVPPHKLSKLQTLVGKYEGWENKGGKRSSFYVFS